MGRWNDRRNDRWRAPDDQKYLGMSATRFNLTVVGIGLVALAAFLYFGGVGVIQGFFADDSSSSPEVIARPSQTTEPSPTATPMSTLESSDKGQLSRLLFSSHSTEPSLYTVTADASNLTLIDTVMESGAIPSPDGEKLVVDCRPRENRAGRITELCLYTKDGLEARIQTAELTQAIVWAPDSQRLAFVTKVENDQGTQLGSELYIIDATNGSVRSLFSKPAGAFRKPRWSPDSRQVALLADYSLRWSPPQRTDLEVVNVQDGEQISLGGASEFAWAPDSSALAFIGRELYSVASDGSNLRRLTDGGESGFDVWSGGGPPVWSPDGRWIAVSVLQPDRASRIFIASAEGRQGQLLAPDLFRITSPVWSPDSYRLAFVGQDDGLPDPLCGRGSALYVTDLANRTPRQLTMSLPFTYFPLVTWSPDGDRLFYTTRSGLTGGYGHDPASLAKLLPCIEGGPTPFLSSVTVDSSGSPVQLTDFGVNMFLGWQPQP